MGLPRHPPLPLALQLQLLLKRWRGEPRSGREALLLSKGRCHRPKDGFERRYAGQQLYYPVLSCACN